MWLSIRYTFARQFNRYPRHMIFWIYYYFLSDPTPFLLFAMCNMGILFYENVTIMLRMETFPNICPKMFLLWEQSTNSLIQINFLMIGIEMIMFTLQV